jgi:CBS domain-containing protein
MVTDRDITIRAVSEGKDPFSTKITEVMTPDVFYCLENEDIREAAKIMEDKSIHRLLVLNNDYEPIGFVSLSDIACKSHDEHLTWEVLEKISELSAPNR